MPKENRQVVMHLVKDDANGNPKYTNNTDEATGFLVYLDTGGVRTRELEWFSALEAETYATELANEYKCDVEYV